MRKKSCKNRKKRERKIKNEQKVTLSAQCCQMATTIILRYKHKFGEKELKRPLSIRKCQKKNFFLNRFYVRALNG